MAFEQFSRAGGHNADDTGDILRAGVYGCPGCDDKKPKPKPEPEPEPIKVDPGPNTPSIDTTTIKPDQTQQIAPVLPPRDVQTWPTANPTVSPWQQWQQTVQGDQRFSPNTNPTISAWQQWQQTVQPGSNQWDQRFSPPATFQTNIKPAWVMPDYPWQSTGGSTDTGYYPSAMTPTDSRPFGTGGYNWNQQRNTSFWPGGDTGMSANYQRQQLNNWQASDADCFAMLNSPTLRPEDRQFMRDLIYLVFRELQRRSASQPQNYYDSNSSQYRQWQSVPSNASAYMVPSGF